MITVVHCEPIEPIFTEEPLPVRYGPVTVCVQVLAHLVQGLSEESEEQWAVRWRPDVGVVGFDSEGCLCVGKTPEAWDVRYDAGAEGGRGEVAAVEETVRDV